MMIIKALDKGFVRLVDYMGSDARIVQSARVSYGSGTKSLREDKDLIAYLLRNKHTSPFEQVVFTFHLKMPIFVARQWVRHRTARCLSGNTLLHFDLPGGISRRGNQLYKLSVEEVYQKFQPTINTRADKQGNAFHKKLRIQAMCLRCVDPITYNVKHTNIVDIWPTGKQAVYGIYTEKGSYAEITEDHLCLTNKGMLPLKSIVTLDKEVIKSFPEMYIYSVGVGHNASPISFNSIDEITEIWKDIPGYEGIYAVSNQGRIMRISPTQGAIVGKIKKLTVYNSHAIVSLSLNGVTATKQVHDLVLRAFTGAPQTGQVCRHLDGNGLNNLLSNLCWGTYSENSSDAMQHGTTTTLSCNMDTIIQVERLGFKQTFDIEVLGPHHNFSAGGLVVHNCNEISGRYSVMSDEFYVPDESAVRAQSKDNKQGRSEQEMDPEISASYIASIEAGQKKLYEDYTGYLQSDIARELARINLPLSIYTEMYWQMDLHNLFHFLNLRLHPHAQSEIREYARAIGTIVAQIVPIAWEAFEEHILYAKSFSRTEMLELLDMIEGKEMSRLEGKARTEFLAKLF